MTAGKDQESLCDIFLFQSESSIVVYMWILEIIS